MCLQLLLEARFELESCNVALLVLNVAGFAFKIHESFIFTFFSSIHLYENVYKLLLNSYRY